VTLWQQDIASQIVRTRCQRHGNRASCPVANAHVSAARMLSMSCVMHVAVLTLHRSATARPCIAGPAFAIAFTSAA